MVGDRMDLELVARTAQEAEHDPVADLGGDDWPRSETLRAWSITAERLLKSETQAWHPDNSTSTISEIANLHK